MADTILEFSVQLALLIILIALALFVSAFIAPFILAGMAYRYYINTPEYKEKKATEKVAALYQTALDIPQTEVSPITIQNHDWHMAFAGLLQFEGLLSPPEPPAIANSLEGARYADRITHYINNRPDLSRVLDFLDQLFLPFVDNSPPGLFKAQRSLTPEQVDMICREMAGSLFFPKLIRIFDARAEHLGWARDYKGDDVALTFFEDTPLELLAHSFSLNVDLKDRFEHTHIIAGTGSGKTQLIQYMISKDLEEDCTIIVIDNQNQLIPNLAKLGEDMQYISPSYPLALNLFDMPSDRHTAPLLQYVLSGLMNAPLTAKQELIFQFGVTLMLAVKGNINTFQDLLAGKEFDLSKVDATTRRFFEEEFYKTGREGYSSTRSEISWRIWSLLKNPVLRDMFAATENRCALELDRKLILIDCNVDLLQDYSGMFGKFFIAQLLQIAQQRFAKPGRPIYVYIDECYYYLDQNIASMLETARKAKIGLVLAHQYFGQITEDKVAKALVSLTSTKFAAQLSPSDAYSMAQSMRTTPEYIQGQEKLHFALWQKGEDTLSIEVPYGTIEAMLQTDPDDTEMIRRYGRPTTATPTPESREPMMAYEVDEKGKF